jgi:hypothetical protein
MSAIYTKQSVLAHLDIFENQEYLTFKKNHCKKSGFKHIPSKMTFELTAK